MAAQRLLAVSPNLPCAMDRQEWSLEDYHICKTLYNGYAAQVYTATCRYSGIEVVLKIYQDVDKAPDVAQHEMYREVAIQSGLQHPNVVHLFGAFEEGDTLVLVQEYVPNGDLLALMQSHGGRVDETTVVKAVLRPLLGALMYLHRWGIVHRDIKPENVLFAADGSVKLADFGLAINMVEERPISRVGTLDYMAPEVLRCPIKQSMAMTPPPGAPARYGFATDVWAVGIVTFELLSGLPPFASDCRYQAESRICSSLPPIFPHSISPMARDFILRALAPIPGDRPTIRQLIDHPWIVSPEACLASKAGRLHMHPYPFSHPYSQSQPQQERSAVLQSQATMSFSPAAASQTSEVPYGGDPEPPLSAASRVAVSVSPSPRPTAAASAPPSAASTAAASPDVSPTRLPAPLSQLSAAVASVVTTPRGSPISQMHHQHQQHHQQQLSQQQQHSQEPLSNLQATAGAAKPVLSIDQQLRALQQQQLLDLSRLPLGQIQGMIQKLQEAMQFAVVQQQQMQQQQPQRQPVFQPADSEASAVHVGNTLVAAVVSGTALAARSRCSGGGDVVRPAVSNARPAAGGEDVYMADVAQELSQDVLPGTTDACTVVSRIQAAAGPLTARSAAAYSCSNSPQGKILHPHQQELQQRRAAGAAAPSIVSLSAAVDSASHVSAATEYASLCASRRTTADVTPRAIVTVAASDSPTQVSRVRYQIVPEAPPQVLSTRSAEGGSDLEQVATLTTARTDGTVAGVAATPRPTCSGGGFGRCSHGGALHEGDGLVYVSIGSSRKAGGLQVQPEGHCNGLGLVVGSEVDVPVWVRQLGTS
ncbi:hypothetical protein VaNZ11_005536 [Volvox africanus]|uniref:Protein kinase domain-containing protein n=1 Tax=Volvox africanus TaxID=51714 RepID=A0ABQ5RZZ2_9CHLO|nr:hypothetical protein VaNZ11_005536 [Volvox africanus]